MKKRARRELAGERERTTKRGRKRGHRDIE